MSRWFRSYADTHRNPKVAKLSDSDFRLWHELLCVAAENDGIIPPLDELKHLLKRRLDHLSSALKRLISGELIDPLEDGYGPRNWGERQYKSDTSTERVHKHRAKRNVSVTPPDTEADTEKTPIPPEGGRRGKTFIPSDWTAPSISELPPRSRACAEQWTNACYQTEAEAFRLYWHSERKMKSDWTATWANRVIARHSAVMRDQKFGNAPTEAKRPPTPEERRTNLQNLIPFYEKIGRKDDADDCRRKLASIGTIANDIVRRAAQ